MDPIAASEAMARPDAVVSVMPFGYGYVSYARDGFRPHPLSFANIPPLGRHGPIGSALGGTGIAVSAFSAHPRGGASTMPTGWPAARCSAASTPPPAASPATPRPGRTPTVNADAGDFYRDTRATLEGAYVRPRHQGYMAFQEAASQRINAGLLSKAPAREVVASLNHLFYESF